MQMSDTVFSNSQNKQQTQVNAIQKLYDAAYGAKHKKFNIRLLCQLSLLKKNRYNY